MTPQEKLNSIVETTIAKLLQRWYPLENSQEKTMYEQLYKTKWISTFENQQAKKNQANQPGFSH